MNPTDRQPALLQPRAIVFVCRALFILYFLAILVSHLFPQTFSVLQHISLVWSLYLLLIYLTCEKIYAVFLRRGIDLSYAFPLVFAVFILNAVSLLVRSQEQVPIINRAEHLATFVLVAYIVWTFFLKYLPQKVWEDHPYYTAILTLSLTALAGVGNEIVELALDHIFFTKTVGPAYDTSLDLLMNTLGAGLFLAVQLILHEGRVARTRSN
ncbi:MAG: hypothetical protein HYR90_04515 [Candidatus Andersenbacteria bacterium]|nr:hypothetical protein [Candidatus Andersenbacteria bacterium]MBI3250464.1 hypothetical protein [Candidatus Andersenbacteria bacterium]